MVKGWIVRTVRFFEICNKTLCFPFMGQLLPFSMFASQNIREKWSDLPPYLVGRYGRAIFVVVLPWLGLSFGGLAYAGPHEDVDSLLSVTVIDGSVTGISEFLAFGPWEIPSRSSWHKAPTELPVGADGNILWGQLEEPPFNAKPHLTGNADNGIDYSRYAGTVNDWKGNCVMLLACKVVAPERALVVFDISNDDNVEVHVNGKYLGVAGNWVLPQGGQFHAFPVMLEKGENTLVFKHVTSNRTPRFKVNVVCDGSREFAAAWGPKEGLLTRLVYTPDRPQEKPFVQWPSLLGHMAVQAEVTDVFSDKTLQMQILRNGDLLQLDEGGDGHDAINGVYSVRYKNGSSWGEEQFVVGDPRKIKEQLENCMKRLCRDQKATINAEALLRRLEILCEPDNYKPNDRRWQEKTVYTICSLAGLLGALERENPDPARDATGLHFRGFPSSLDISTQHYHLYVPSTYQRGKKLPLLIIMPTSVTASHRSFLESAFIASHRDAVRLGRIAERYGFAVLWSGYRNAPAGLPCENTHLDEVLKAVQEDYDLDLHRIHLYGACSGGIFAGNAVAKWPERFASIIYNKAIFTRVADEMPGIPEAWQEWFRITDPVEEILRNNTISAFITNTEETQFGHGEIELSLAFMNKAIEMGKTVTADMTPPDINDTAWDRVFQWAASSRLKMPSDRISDRNPHWDYSGPPMEVFATPIMIVKGTLGSEIENNYIEEFIQNFQQCYADRFYGAKCRVRKDTELSDADAACHSLILVGNSAINSVFKKFQNQAKLSTTDNEIVLDDMRWNGKLVYHLVIPGKI
jgi:hypothetical protein